MPGWSLPHNANGRARHLACAPAALATPVRIGVGVARTFVVAIRSRVEECAVAGLGDHRLCQHRCCDDARENGRSVGAEAEKRRVPERDDPGQSENEIERQSEQAGDEHFVDDRRARRLREDRRQNREPEAVRADIVFRTRDEKYSEASEKEAGDVYEPW